MVQGTHAAAGATVVVSGAGRTLAEVEKLVDGIVVDHLRPRFGSVEAVRRFANVRSEAGRVVVSASIEHEAVALARVVIAELSGHGIEARVHRNPNPWIEPAQRGVFYSPTSVDARRFAVHLDLSPAPAA